MKLIALACIFLLSACASESSRAKQEIEDIRSTKFAGRTAENAALCSGYQKLAAAYLKEGKRPEYENAQIFITAHC